ncbi:MAG: fibronectin type III domain-containing protein, partial [Opitutaceae bacterium]
MFTSPLLASAPSSPTGVSATAGVGQATISFTASGSTGGTAIRYYEVTSSPGSVSATGGGSPIVINGLTNGTSYTFTVKAYNSDPSNSSSVASTASNSITPSSSGTYRDASNVVYSYHTGSLTASVGPQSGTLPSGAITIPSSILVGGNTYNVTSIGYSGFENCSGITSVSIPNSVTSIGSRAFRSDTALTGITLPSSLQSIPSSCFFQCSGLAQVDFPATSNLVIESSAFNGCTALRVIAIPDSVSAILDSAFSGCSRLTTVTLPSGLTILSNSTFSSCGRLSTISLPSTLTTISANCFLACNGLTTIAIPAAVTSIATQAFSGCGSLGKVYFMGSAAPTTAVSAFNNIATGAIGYYPNGGANYVSTLAVLTPQLAFTAANYAAPGVPTAVSAEAGNNEATVSFAAPVPDGSAGILSYTVTASPGGATASGYASPLTVTGLTNGNSYTFTVTATNAIGTGTSSSASGSVTPLATLPGRPTNTKAAFNTGASGTIFVSFSTPVNNGGTAITNYEVTAQVADGSTIETVTTTGASSPISVTGLTNARPYIFTVRANNGSRGAASDVSNWEYPSTPPAAPTNVVAVAANGSATLSFTPPATIGGGYIQYYNVYITGGTYNRTYFNKIFYIGTPVVVTGLTNGTAYTFKMTATNFPGGQTSPDSAASNSITPVSTVAGTPTSVSVTTTDTTATVSFSAPTSGPAITSYTVTAIPSDGSTAVTATGASTSINVTGLTTGLPYYFSVTATAANGSTSAAQVTTNASTTAATAPSAPTGVAATAGAGQATVSFTAPSDNGSAITSYTVTATPFSGSSVTATGSSSPITVTGLTPFTSYTFTVKATNLIGTGSDSAASAAVTPYSVPNAPTSVTAIARNGAATVKFTAPSTNGLLPITGFTVTSTPGNITATAATSPISISGLTNGTSYTFKVTATNAAGTGAASSASPAVTPLVTLPFCSISSIVPASGPAGATVTIRGYGFTGLTGVTVGGVAATELAVINDYVAQATIPVGSGAATIVVTTPGGTSSGSSGNTWTYASTPYLQNNLLNARYSPAQVWDTNYSLTGS